MLDINLDETMFILCMNSDRYGIVEFKAENGDVTRYVQIINVLTRTIIYTDNPNQFYFSGESKIVQSEVIVGLLDMASNKLIWKKKITSSKPCKSYTSLKLKDSYFILSFETDSELALMNFAQSSGQTTWEYHIAHSTLNAPLANLIYNPGKNRMVLADRSQGTYHLSLFKTFPLEFDKDVISSASLTSGRFEGMSWDLDLDRIVIAC